MYVYLIGRLLLPVYFFGLIILFLMLISNLFSKKMGFKNLFKTMFYIVIWPLAMISYSGRKKLFRYIGKILGQFSKAIEGLKRSDKRIEDLNSQVVMEKAEKEDLTAQHQLNVKTIEKMESFLQ